MVGEWLMWRLSLGWISDCGLRGETPLRDLKKHPPKPAPQRPEEIQGARPRGGLHFRRDFAMFCEDIRRDAWA